MLKKEMAAITRFGKVVGEYEVFAQLKAKENTLPFKPSVTEKKALNFLKLLKRSEFKVMKQLDKMPAQISILYLLLTSEFHREALFRVLNETRIPRNILIEKFTHVVENVLASNHITFSDENLISERIEHNKVLYISVRYNEKLLPRVLIDNESDLNICP